jgi:hypothetical protein
VGGVYDQALGSVSWCANASCSQILCTDTTVADGFVCHSNSDEILDLLAPDYRTGTTALGGGIETAFGGTSAASPYAAAQAALLLEVDPTLTPDGIRTLLTSHGTQVTNPDNGLSFPRSDVQQALNSLSCGNGSLDSHEECDPSAGSLCCNSSCAFASAGTACDDGDACTSGDTCSAGACSSVGVLDCDDGDPCTGDGCDALAGCFHTPVIGCVSPEVPALSAGPRALLVGLLVAVGLGCAPALRRRAR